MKGLLFRRLLLLTTFACNLFALFSAVLAFLAIPQKRVPPSGTVLFFYYVLLFSPILSIIVVATSPWEKPADPQPVSSLTESKSGLDVQPVSPVDVQAPSN